MSARVTGVVWDWSEHKGTELLVLLAIADSADSETGQCYPSVRYLAEKVRLSRRAVQYAIRSLVESGELDIVKKGGWDRANVYRINEEQLRKRRGAQNMHPVLRVAP